MPDPTWDESEPIQVAANAPQAAAPKWEDSEPVAEPSALDQYKGIVENVERSATLGLSDLYRTKIEQPFMEAIGLPKGVQTGQEELARRKAQLGEGTEIATGLLGGAALLGATGGLGGIAEGLAGAGAKTLVGHALTMGTEGALFGAGNAVSDYALGDPTLNAQKVLSYIGTGAAIGGGLGVLSKGAEFVLPGLKNALKSVRGAQELPESLPVSGSTDVSQPVVDAIETAGVKPTSLQEISDRVKAARYTGEVTDLPEKAALVDASSRVEMQNPIHPLQVESLSDQRARDAYKTLKEIGDQGKDLQTYEALQKNELVSKADQAIKDILPGHTPESDAVKGGEDAIKTFTDQYQAEKKEVGQLISKMKEIPIKTPNKLVTIVGKLSEDLPAVGNAFDTTGDAIKLKPYNGGMGISQKAYSALKDVVRDIKANPKADFETLQSIRNRIAEKGDVLEHSAVANELRTMRKSMMDYMQDRVQQNVPDMQVREAFKRYAINEQEREAIERTFGASVGSQEFGAASKVKPEQIGDKIFANTANVGAAKKILEPKQFNKILANYIAEGRQLATDPSTKAFSSNKFSSWMKRNQDALGVAFSDKPESLQRLKDVTTMMRILPDSVSVNPSGTTKTLISYLKGVHGTVDLAGAIGRLIKDKTLEKLNEQIITKNINEQLAGSAARHTMLSEIGNMVNKTTESISNGAKSIFNGNSVRGGIMGAGSKALSPSSYDKKAEDVQKHSSNPEGFADHLADATDTLYHIAPNITQGIHNAMVASVNFLNSKLPKPAQELPLSAKWEPTQSQKTKFLRYYQAVDNPLVALKQVKDGTISGETMEALMAVHPDLLNEMRMKVMENIHPERSKKLNYATKMSLSKFLGQPLDEGMMPQVMQSNQSVFAAANQAAQQQKAGQQTAKMSASRMSQTRTQQLEMS